MRCCSNALLVQCRMSLLAGEAGPEGDQAVEMALAAQEASRLAAAAYEMRCAQPDAPSPGEGDQEDAVVEDDAEEAKSKTTRNPENPYLLKVSVIMERRMRAAPVGKQSKVAGEIALRCALRGYRPPDYVHIIAGFRAGVIIPGGQYLQRGRCLTTERVRRLPFVEFVGG